MPEATAKRDWDDFSFLPEEELEKLRGFVAWFKERQPNFGKNPHKMSGLNLDDDYNYKHYYELTEIGKRGRR